jgi:hypothetical protein
MNNKELMEFMKNSHEFTLMEMRLLNEDVKEHIADKYEKRITYLEHFKTYVHAVTGTFILLFAWVKAHSK